MSTLRIVSIAAVVALLGCGAHGQGEAMMEWEGMDILAGGAQRKMPREDCSCTCRCANSAKARDGAHVDVAEGLMTQAKEMQTGLVF